MPSIRPAPTSSGHLAIVATLTRNRVIGTRDSAEERKHFDNVTAEHTIIMCGDTYMRLTKPYENRVNIVITDTHITDSTTDAPVLDVPSFRRALIYTTDNLPMVIGGAALFEEALPLASDMYLTLQERDVSGDAYFPKWSDAEWECVDSAQAATPGVTFTRWKRRL